MLEVYGKLGANIAVHHPGTVWDFRIFWKSVSGVFSETSGVQFSKIAGKTQNLY